MEGKVLQVIHTSEQRACGTHSQALATRSDWYQRNTAAGFFLPINAADLIYHNSRILLIEGNRESTSFQAQIQHKESWRHCLLDQRYSSDSALKEVSRSFPCFFKTFPLWKCRCQHRFATLRSSPENVSPKRVVGMQQRSHRSERSLPVMLQSPSGSLNWPSRNTHRKKYGKIWVARKIWVINPWDGFQVPWGFGKFFQMKGFVAKTSTSWTLEQKLTLFQSSEVFAKHCQMKVVLSDTS